MASVVNNNNDTTDPRDHAGDFSNYDVLLAKDMTGDLILDSKQSHIGNNRFQVLLNMHQSEFEDALIAGASADAVVKRVIDIVCRQCVPKGRFLLSEGNQSWIVLTEMEAEDFVTDYLMSPECTHRALGSNPDALTNSLASPKTTSPGVADMEPLRATIGDTGGDGEKKRRRRSSLLRRSMSEGGFDDNKKSTRRSVRFPNMDAVSWIPKLFTRQKPASLDVVFNAEKTALVEGHTGNNRLRVMVSMQRESYRTGGSQEKYQLVQNVMETVTDSWKGRFLAEKGNGGRGGYEVLTDENEQITLAIRCLFDPDAAEAMASISLIAPMEELVIEDTDVSARRPSFVKKKTLQALHQIKPANADQDLRTAAVASLQKRKQRQGLTSRIRDLSAGALPMAAPVSGGLQRSVSEPIHPDNLTPFPTQMHSASTTDGYLDVAVNRPASEARDEARLSMIRDSLYSHNLPEGMIEDLLSGLDVSEDFLPSSEE